MNFFTPITVPILDDKISYQSKIISLGSCFAVHMAARLGQYQFVNTVNPFGILFHPLAHEKLVDFAVKGHVFTPSDVFLHNDVWSCFDAHSDLNALEEEDILFQLNLKIRALREDLITGSHLIITLGTAWVYSEKSTQHMVANCHKLPQHIFEKTLLDAQIVKESLERLYLKVKELNPKIKLIYTISPVRHIKDGMIENQRSKSVLFVGLHDFMDTYKEVYYFPSYEMLVDELRDYRYYGPDLIHPNEIALQFVWEKFKESCIEATAFPVMKLVDEVQKGLAHRAFNPYSNQHQIFLEKIAEKIDHLLEQYPHMNFR